jgi:hypothetical protein
MEGIFYVLNAGIFVEFKRNGRKRLSPNTGIIVEYKR